MVPRFLLVTKDKLFHDEEGNQVWRPSENVVHELGAAWFAYEDRGSRLP